MPPIPPAYPEAELAPYQLWLCAGGHIGFAAGALLAGLGL